VLKAKNSGKEGERQGKKKGKILSSNPSIILRTGILSLCIIQNVHIAPLGVE